MKSVPNIEIRLDEIKEGLRVWIDARGPESLFDAEESASENNEARFQLVEGCLYDFSTNDTNITLGDIGSNIVQTHKRKTNIGTIAPNIFVGTLSIPIVDTRNGHTYGSIDFEVQSIKSSYREDYRDMLEFITEKCTDLLLQSNSPVSHYFEVDYTKSPQTLYQKFAFIKSVIGSDDFAEAIHRIVTSPETSWTEITEEKDIRNTRRFSNSNINEILKRSNRSPLPENQYLRKLGLSSLPQRITVARKTDSVDTPENRFIKHALEVFLKFCTDVNCKAKEFKQKQADQESELLIKELEQHLHHSFFREITKPSTLKLNSPVLQRKEGYREILRVWLMFDLAAKLIWSGGDDIYHGGKKDVAVLYEYWLFFKLLELLESIFDIEPRQISKLIQQTEDGLNLQIKQGKHIALQGTYVSGARKLNIRFNYNRLFSGRKDYPTSGSWTTSLRPDYTLSIWPLGISEEIAEKQELIVHVHFDAKYKVSNLRELFNGISNSELDDEKTENRKGIYKNADLLKMHAYKDAIRRTGGAYVLYPGDESINYRGFHEIIPGLGAFSVKPSKLDSGIGELKVFILEIVEHFLNRASQREKLAYRTYEIFKDNPDPDSVVTEPLPEAYNENRGLIPDETFVLVGYYHPEQYNWIKRNRLYNFRMGTGPGSLMLDRETVEAKYLLLHTMGETSSGELWRIVSEGPQVYSKEDMVSKGYRNPSQDNYLVIRIERVEDNEFKNVKWNFKKLSKYNPGRASALPFTTTLAELMKNKAK